MSDEDAPIGEELREVVDEIQSYNESVGDEEEIEIPDELNDKLVDALSSDPLYRRMISEAMKQSWIQQHLIEGLEREQQVLLTKTIFYFSFISNEDEVEWYLEKDHVKSVYEQVQDDFEDGSVSEDLVKIYNENLEPVLSEFSDRKEEIREDIFGDSYEHLLNIEKSDREDKEEIIERIVADHKNANNAEMWGKNQTIR